jgi:hypothetical protein
MSIGDADADVDADSDVADVSSTSGGDARIGVDVFDDERLRKNEKRFFFVTDGEPSEAGVIGVAGVAGVAKATSAGVGVATGVGVAGDDGLGGVDGVDGVDVSGARDDGDDGSCPASNDMRFVRRFRDATFTLGRDIAGCDKTGDSWSPLPLPLSAEMFCSEDGDDAGVDLLGPFAPGSTAPNLDSSEAAKADTGFAFFFFADDDGDGFADEDDGDDGDEEDEDDDCGDVFDSALDGVTDAAVTDAALLTGTHVSVMFTQLFVPLVLSELNSLKSRGPSFSLSFALPSSMRSRKRSATTPRDSPADASNFVE